MNIPVYQLSLSENQVIGRNVSLQVLLPEAVCCCLQTCNCGFDIRVVLCIYQCTKSHSQER